MEIFVLALIKDHTKTFQSLYPNFKLTQQDLDLLFLLIKYELLVSEQFCIDKLLPSLNIDLLVNWGGQPNKGSTGFQFSEEKKLEWSFNLMGRKFSDFTKNLHRNNMIGITFFAETRAKMS